MKTITIELPAAPSMNRMWRTTKQGRTYLDPKAAAYKEEVARLARLHGIVPLPGPVRLDIVWYRKRKQGDLSNRLKLLEDGLTGVAYADDAQVVEITMRREEATAARMEVRISWLHVLTMEVAAVSTKGFKASGPKAEETTAQRMRRLATSASYKP